LQRVGVGNSSAEVEECRPEYACIVQVRLGNHREASVNHEVDRAGGSCRCGETLLGRGQISYTEAVLVRAFGNHRRTREIVERRNLQGVRINRAAVPIYGNECAAIDRDLDTRRVDQVVVGQGKAQDGVGLDQVEL